METGKWLYQSTLCTVKSLQPVTIVTADPTNGRAYATMLHPSVCHLSVTYVLSLNGVSCRKTV